MPHVLAPHPAAETPAPVRVAATAVRRVTTLHLIFVATGDLDRVQWPASATPARADELWRATCFEAFVQADGSPGYVELNLSPSGCWAAYAFEGYRSGMRDLALPRTPEIIFSRTADRAELTAAVDLSHSLPATAPWRLGLSAVIEDADRRIAYHALRHAPGKPDFHHPDAFALQLTDDA